MGGGEKGGELREKRITVGTLLICEVLERPRLAGSERQALGFHDDLQGGRTNVNGAVEAPATRERHQMMRRGTRTESGQPVNDACALWFEKLVVFWIRVVAQVER